MNVYQEMSKTDLSRTPYMKLGSCEIRSSVIFSFVLKSKKVCFFLGASKQSGQTSSNMGNLKRIIKEISIIQRSLDGVFILDSDPDNLEQSSIVPVGFPQREKKDSIIIVGRVLPTAYPYNQRSFRLQIHVTCDFPFHPPKIRLLDMIYHPNIDHDGHLCIPLLSILHEWTMAVNIATIIREIVDLIDHPRLDESRSSRYSQRVFA